MGFCGRWGSKKWLKTFGQSRAPGNITIRRIGAHSRLENRDQMLSAAIAGKWSLASSMSQK